METYPLISPEVQPFLPMVFATVSHKPIEAYRVWIHETRQGLSNDKNPGYSCPPVISLQGHATRNNLTLAV